MNRALLDHCVKSAVHHGCLAKEHKRMGELHAKLAAASDDDTADCHEELSTLHRAMATHHEDHRDHFINLHKAIESGTDVELTPSDLTNRGDVHDDGPKVSGGKAAAGSPFARAMGLDKIKPDGVHAVFPSDAGHNNRLVLRSGGVSPNVDLGRIDPELRRLVEMPDE